MKSQLLGVAGLLFVGVLSGCASVVTGHNQSLSVETPGCPGVSCKLSNDKGTWYATTPGSVTVRRAYSPLALECSKDGFASVTREVQSSTKAMAFGNILLGGVIGAGVDVATGAAYDYPEVIAVPFACGPDARTSGARTEPSPPATPGAPVTPPVASTVEPAK